MTKPIIEILDVITGEETRREMTDKEYADELKRRESNEAIKIANENKRQAAIDKLAALGLTPDDLNALGA
jgi:hypothetical protein